METHYEDDLVKYLLDAIQYLQDCSAAMLEIRQKTDPTFDYYE
jgi:hypothetical protein